MRDVSWGISGYIVLLNSKPIGQFDSCGWACEFQRMVSDKHKGQYVTILYDTGNSTMVTQDEEQQPVEKEK